MDIIRLRRYFYTTLDYNELKNHLNGKIGLNYKLGLVDNKVISIYYLKDKYTDIELDRVPICKIEIRNKKRRGGLIRIEFMIARFALIAIGLIPLFFMLVLYFAEAPIPFYYASALYPVVYMVLVFILIDQSDKFKLELRKLETGTII